MHYVKGNVGCWYSSTMGIYHDSLIMLGWFVPAIRCLVGTCNLRYITNECMRIPETFFFLIHFRQNFQVRAVLRFTLQVIFNDLNYYVLSAITFLAF